MRCTFAALLLIVLSSDLFAQIEASLKFRSGSNYPSFVMVDEGTSILINYETSIRCTRSGDRFIANRPPQPFNGTVMVPTGNPQAVNERIIHSQFNVTDDAVVSGSGSQFRFDAKNDGVFYATMTGSVKLERNFNDFVGDFPFSVRSQDIIVRNVAPIFLGSYPDIECTVGGEFYVYVSAFDPGVDDGVYFLWDLNNDGSPDIRTNGTSVNLPLIANAVGVYPIRITVKDKNEGSNSIQFKVKVTPTTLASRGVFYGGATGSGFQNLVASDKRPLLPGQSSTFANYSNYSRGINGISVDIRTLPINTDEMDLQSSFQFAAWDGIDPQGFQPIQVTPSITIGREAGTGSSTRVYLAFTNNVLQNTWLRTTVLANSATGLAINDVSYFGNVIGDFNVGNTSTRLRVNAQDTSAIRANQSVNPNSVGITNVYDVNKDGRVNAEDTSIVRANQQAVGIVAPITVPASSPPLNDLPTEEPLKRTDSIEVRSSPDVIRLLPN